MRLSFFLLTSAFLVFLSCNSNDEEDYVAVSPVSVDLTQVPYPKLSDYKFFDGELKNLTPSLDVLPYKPASSLFSDYAHKKRFVWMPKGSKATFNGDASVLELPVGSALIKNFYYDHVQPSHTTKIIETRIMIRKASGWIFANYVWNDAQTEAYLDLNGSYQDISWTDENSQLKNVTYRIPSEVQCITCHKTKETINNVEQTIYIPIGIKPQNLNFNYNYGSEVKNQLTKWIEAGYLDNNFTLPTAANTTVDYEDTSKPIDLRARSYVDINCAHCHTDNKHCDYRPMRFGFSQTGGTNGNTNMGACVNTEDMQGFPSTLAKIVAPGNINKSMLYFRINTTNETYRMPLHGRTLIHTEGVALMEQWINSLGPCQ
ncbi:hypothetical protein ABGT15_02370 [Flavobacterium enshiense]|uniref:hypothetical protein n=1 Tax=Flavobacterium enshiense TaxID=1341165 RepID=UPI00345DFD71